VTLKRRTGRYADKQLSPEEKIMQKQRDATFVETDKWEAADTYVWFPRQAWKQKWDMLIMILILYSCISVPFRIGMMADAVGYMWLFEVCVTLFFLTDLTFNFNTAYLEGPHWVIDRGMIANNYLRSWFTIDALSSFPVELVALLAPADESADATGMKALRALRMVRLLRMLRLLKVQQYIDDLEDRTGMNMQVLQIVKMVLGLLYLMHLLGCFWFYVGHTPGYDTSWLAEYDGGSGLDAPTDVQYLYSVYWALTTLTTVGYGDIVPTNNAERWYSLVSLLIGALVFGYMLSSIGDLLSNVDKNAVKLDGKLDDVKEFTRWHHMPPELAARVRKYFEVFYNNKSAMDEEEILSNLAPALKREVVSHLLGKTVARIPMFSDEFCDYASDRFRLEVHPLLKPLVYDLDEVAINKHGHGDALYYLNKGTVGACAALDNRILFAISDAGSCFGEHIIINQPADLTYKAITRCELFCLGKADLYALLERFPEARREVADFLFEDLLRHKMLRYWAFRMVASEVRGRDEVVAAALQLQVAWMRRTIIKLQALHAENDDAHATIMPGLFGIEAALASARGTGSSTPLLHSHRASSSGAAAVVAPVAVHAAAPPPPAVVVPADVQTALTALEGERGKLQRKDAQMDAQLRAIQASLEKLTAGLNTA